MATINIEIVEGRGSVIAKKNGNVVSTINPGNGIVPLSYNVGDTFEFDAYPDTTLGYTFNKFCGDASCALTTTSNPFTGTVSSDGYVGAYFKGTPATVQVGIAAGQGKVDVYRNTRLIGTVTGTTQTFNFFVNDTFTFTATPAANNQFEKYCSDTSCTITTTTNPYSGTITATGAIMAYFTGGGGGGNATITVQRSQGSGSVSVLKNGVALGTLAETETSKVFNFSIGDTFSFTATPSSGFKFDKFCADQACTITTTTNPFTGSVTQATGNVFTYFSASTTQVGAISFTSNPAGAEITLDNVVQASKTPATVTGIPVGTHNYILKLSGYEDSKGTITVQANTTASVNVTLSELLYGLPKWQVYGGAALVGFGLLALILTRRPSESYAPPVRRRRG